MYQWYLLAASPGTWWIIHASDASPGFIVHVKSNLGIFFLTRGGAGESPLDFIDMDGELESSVIPDRYFCELPFGPVRGLCLLNETAATVLSGHALKMLQNFPRKCAKYGRDGRDGWGQLATPVDSKPTS